jgi:DedD protein
MTESQQDTEITLGTGKMLGLFFALVVVCAVFFAIGFSLGKKSAPGGTASVPATQAGTSSTARPEAGKIGSAAPSSDFTFYKAVEQKTADGQLATPETTAQTTGQPAPPPAEAAKTPAAEAAPPPSTLPAATSTSSYFVQVAAVTRQEDADALVEALKKKNYPAFTATSAAADKLFHVQVGPFGELKDAQDMRNRLVADGYNPIVKK